MKYRILFRIKQKWQLLSMKFVAMKLMVMAIRETNDEERLAELISSIAIRRYAAKLPRVIRWA